MGNACTAIDLAALSKARIRHDPWPWGTYDGVFFPSVLNAEFPHDHFSFHSQRRILEALGKEKMKSWYQHNVRTRPLLELRQEEPFKSDTLDPAWLAVAKDLVSQDFRECLSDVVEHDVRHLDMQAHFWEFAEGSFFQPHVDKSHKIVTFLMYLTPDWSKENGGCLQVLASGDPADVCYTVPPRANTAVFLKRKPNAWHAVSEIPLGVKKTRVLLQAWFWESS